MDVLIDGTAYQYQSHGGVSRIYSEILPRMCDLDPELRITLLTTGRCQRTLPSHPGIRHRPLVPIDDILRPSRLWWPVLQAGQSRVKNWAAREHKEAIWHSTYYTHLKKWNRPSVVTVLDMIHERFTDLFTGQLNEWLRAQKKECITSADAIICISDTTKRDVEQFYGIEQANIQVVHLACSPVFRRLDYFDSTVSIPTTEAFLLYVGGRGPYKNFTSLVRTYARWEYSKEIALVVVGTRWSQEEKRLLADNGVADQIHLVGAVDDDALSQLYNRAVALVYPSLYEGFGIPVLEAMACGCHVIASNIPTTLEIADGIPIYFTPTDDDSLIAALNDARDEYLAKDDWRRDMGLEHVKKYAWGITADKTLQVYHGLS